MKKNLSIFSALFFSLISFNFFAGNGVKRVTEMDRIRFIDSAFVYKENKNSPDPK